MLITNRKCVFKNKIENPDDLFKQCTKFKDMRLIEHIGEGSFGSVYRGETTYNSKKINVAVKLIRNCSDENLIDLNLEINYSYNMGILGIGPLIYDAFYYKNQGEDKYEQIIVMEYYPYDGRVALQSVSIQNKKKIIKKMIDLVKQTIFEVKIYCVDLKPENFIVNDNLDVKMIDFGTDWCVPDHLPTLDSFPASVRNNPKIIKLAENHLYQILIFQLYKMISLFTDDISIHSLFINEFSYDILSIIKKYYENDSLTIKFYLDSMNLKIEM